METRNLVEKLTVSFEQQLQWYTRLDALVQGALSKVVLSRGDMSGIMATLTSKQEIVESILAERERMKEAVELWAQRKGNVESTPEIKHLDETLARTQQKIQNYLVGEKQLQKYLEHTIKKLDTESNERDG